MDTEQYSSRGRNRNLPNVSPLVEQLEQAGPQVQVDSVPLKLRLLRWLFPDINRRRAKRYPAPGLVAYYWTGGSPHSYEVANISATGLYLLTKERWAPETMIQMTLQKSENAGQSSEGSISLLSEVVRWGEDGTGFNFILKDYEDLRTREELPSEPVDRKTVEMFLKRVADVVQ
jgi:hypothetical protein